MIQTAAQAARIGMNFSITPIDAAQLLTANTPRIPLKLNSAAILSLPSPVPGNFGDAIRGMPDDSP
jgi:hypothetical protein